MCHLRKFFVIPHQFISLKLILIRHLLVLFHEKSVCQLADEMIIEQLDIPLD